MTVINKAEGEMMDFDNRRIHELQEKKQKERKEKAQQLMLNTYNVFRGTIEKNDASNNNKREVNDQLGVDVSFVHLNLTVDTIKMVIENTHNEKAKDALIEFLDLYENALEAFSNSPSPYFKGI